jgi:hypothetical protein
MKITGVDMATSDSTTVRARVTFDGDTVVSVVREDEETQPFSREEVEKVESTRQVENIPAFDPTAKYPEIVVPWWW